MPRSPQRKTQTILAQQPVKSYAKHTSLAFEIKQKLDTQGFCVVPSVLNPSEIESAKRAIWDSITACTERNGDPVTEDRADSYKFYYEHLNPSHGMLLKHFPEISHSQAVWNVRSHPRVKDIFAEIHETRNLKSSYDAISISLPVMECGYYRGNRSSWYHLDSVKTPNYEPPYCIQGYVNLYDCIDEGDATLYCLEGSHRHFDDFMDEFRGRTPGSQFMILNGEDQELFYTDRGCRVRRVLSRAGDLVLWDSKLVHQGRPRSRGASSTRMAIYTCMRPATEFTDNVLKKRQKWFEMGGVTNHWGNLKEAKNAQTYGGPKPVKVTDEEIKAMMAGLDIDKTLI